MKIVIDIPKEIIISLEQGSFGAKYNMYDLIGCVMNGTPLPEHHGKIADLSAVYEDICNDINEMTRIGVAVDGDWLWGKLNDAIYNAPTIIESDKE